MLCMAKKNLKCSLLFHFEDIAKTMAQESTLRLTAGNGRGIGFVSDASGCFFVHGNRVPLCIEICEEFRYNFDVGKDQ